MMKKLLAKAKLFIAIFSAAVLLAGVVPTGMMPIVAAAEGDAAIVNGDFETGNTSGWAVYAGTAASAEAAYEGSYGVNATGTGGWGSSLTQTIAVSPNTSYAISFWYKAISNGLNVTVQTTGGTKLASKWVNATSWTKAIFTFLSGENTSVKINISGSGIKTPDQVYFDNIQLITVPSDGYFTNTGFETGSTLGWTIYGNTKVSSDAAHTGDYSASVAGTGGWGGLIMQTANISPNTEYVFKMYYKPVTNGVNFTLTGSDGTVYGKLYMNVKNHGTDWNEYKVSFMSGSSTTLTIKAAGSGIGSPDSIYMDDFRLAPVSNDGYLKNGNFETSTTNFWTVSSATSICTGDAHTGNYSLSLSSQTQWGNTAIQRVTMETNTEYGVSFWSKGGAEGNPFSLWALDGANANISETIFENSENWERHEIVFNSKENTSVAFKFGPREPNSAPILIDDVEVKKLGIYSELVGDDGYYTATGATVNSNDPSLSFEAGAHINMPGQYVVTDPETSEECNLYLWKTGDVHPDGIINIRDLVALKKFAAGIVISKAGSAAFDIMGDGNTATALVALRSRILLSSGGAAVCQHVYNSEVITPATALDDGLKRFTCVNCDDTYTEVIPATDSIKILCVGNSFSQDATQYLWNILRDAGIDNVVVGNLHYPGCTLDMHLDYMSNNSSTYTYYKNTDGNMQAYENSTADTALNDEEWDYITLQQGSSKSGLPDDYASLNSVISYVKANNSQAQLYWHMTWAYQQDCTEWGFTNYSNDQMTMYNAIVDTVQDVVVPNQNFAGIIPAGTAIQNMRTTYLGDTLTRDGYHMSLDYGRYTVALMFFKTIFNKPLDGITWVPESYPNITDNRTIINEAVNNASTNPFEVTQSLYPTN